MIKLISKISLFLVILLQSSLAFAQTKPVLNSVRNSLNNLKRDGVLIPVVYSLGFLTTGYILGMFQDIKLYFQQNK